MGPHYGMGMEPQTTVCLRDNESSPHGEAMSVRDMALQIHGRGGFRRCT